MEQPNLSHMIWEEDRNYKNKCTQSLFVRMYVCINTLKNMHIHTYYMHLSMHNAGEWYSEQFGARNSQKLCQELVRTHRGSLLYQGSCMWPKNTMTSLTKRYVICNKAGVLWNNDMMCTYMVLHVILCMQQNPLFWGITLNLLCKKQQGKSPTTIVHDYLCTYTRNGWITCSRTQLKDNLVDQDHLDQVKGQQCIFQSHEFLYCITL